MKLANLALIGIYGNQRWRSVAINVSEAPKDVLVASLVEPNQCEVGRGRGQGGQQCQPVWWQEQDGQGFAYQQQSRQRVRRCLFHTIGLVNVGGGGA